MGAGLATVGGAEIAFFSAGKPESQPAATTLEVRAPQLLERQGAALVQSLKVIVNYPYAEPVDGVVRSRAPRPSMVQLKFGSQTVDLSLPAVEADKAVKVEVEAGGQTVASREVTLKPVRKMRDLPPAALAQRHRLHGVAGRGGEEAEQQHRDGPPARQSHRRLPGRLALQMECRGALVRGQLPARRHAGEARGLHGGGQVRPDRAGRVLLQHPRGPVPAGGAAQPDALRHAAFR